MTIDMTFLSLWYIFLNFNSQQIRFADISYKTFWNLWNVIS